MLNLPLPSRLPRKKVEGWLMAASLIILMSCTMFLQHNYHRIISQANRWVVYYGAGEPAESFAPYDVIVFDNLAHPKLDILKSPHRLILGYLSIGEEATHNPMSIHQQDGVRLEKNTLWGAENYVLDLRSELWAADILQNQIPAILASGFDGIMIDTIDMPLEATRHSPPLHQEMKAAAIKLIKAIRTTYPDLPIMLNRGFEILPAIAEDIDMVLGESVTTMHLREEDSYYFRSEQDNQYIKTILKKAQKENTALRLFSLNYWPPGQGAIIKQIYHMDRDRGYIPYVATPDLAQHIREPGKRISLH